MAKRKKKDRGASIFAVMIGILAATIAFAKGISDGLQPPPGDRRG